MEILTVKIKHSSGYCLINQSDFDPKTHQLFEITSFVNLNTASVKDLTDLPTVGANRAKLIIKNRPYKSVEQAKTRLKDLKWQAIESLIEV